MDTIKFVIVGHIDHGKSTLIGRLLYDTNSLLPDKIEEVRKTSEELGSEKTEFAYLLDHLQEERQQKITIETTQIFFKTNKREYVIIDTPGHIEFIKNMITGASQAEAAILIVDVKEGVRQQTKRYAYILSLLDVKQVIVVLNKMDLVEYKKELFDNVKEDIDKFLTSINLHTNYYIPVSAINSDNVANKSDNMHWYEGVSVLESLDSLKTTTPDECKPFIMPIQDIYKFGDKRIAVGRVEAGVIKTGQEIKVLPGGQHTIINSIEKYLQDVDKAYPGESIGITTCEPIFLERGNIICQPNKEPYLTEFFNAKVFWMSKKELQKEERLTLRCATQEVNCTIKKIETRIDSSSLEIIQKDATKLSNLEVGEVIIKTKKPIAIKPFNEVKELGRFVLVKDEDICAGGIITTIN
jgi:sulfate adenylyltransferase large subunit